MNIMLVGDGMNSTIITASRSLADGFSTFESATLTVVGDKFIARDITIQNTAAAEKHQAVALRVTSNAAFYVGLPPTRTRSMRTRCASSTTSARFRGRSTSFLGTSSAAVPGGRVTAFLFRSTSDVEFSHARLSSSDSSQRGDAPELSAFASNSRRWSLGKSAPSPLFAV
ncbi:pectinesterase [Salvia divinorum]